MFFVIVCLLLPDVSCAAFLVSGHLGNGAESFSEMKAFTQFTLLQ
jgi:hypothetical protein